MRSWQGDYLDVQDVAGARLSHAHIVCAVHGQPIGHPGGQTPWLHGQMKQLDLSWFWLQDVVDQGTISSTYVLTGKMTADLLTKALPRLKVEYFCKQMGLAASRGS